MYLKLTLPKASLQVVHPLHVDNSKQYAATREKSMHESMQPIMITSPPEPPTSRRCTVKLVIIKRYRTTLTNALTDNSAHLDLGLGLRSGPSDPALTTCDL